MFLKGSVRAQILSKKKRNHKIETRNKVFMYVSKGSYKNIQIIMNCQKKIIFWPNYKSNSGQIIKLGPDIKSKSKKLKGPSD